MYICIQNSLTCFQGSGHANVCLLTADYGSNVLDATQASWLSRLDDSNGWLYDCNHMAGRRV